MEAIQLKLTRLLGLLGKGVDSLTLGLFPLWTQACLGIHLRKHVLLAEHQFLYVSGSSGFRPTLLNYQLHISEIFLKGT